jgi:hypothetical protein
MALRAKHPMTVQAPPMPAAEAAPQAPPAFTA